jgi:DNA-directed RNA polymerase sigma subunit (sigma70/sigma32)
MAIAVMTIAASAITARAIAKPRYPRRVADGDPFLRALEDLETTIDEDIERHRAMKKRIRDIRRHRAAGRPYAEIVPAEKRPLIVQLLTESRLALDDVGGRVRRTEARVLHEEGMTMDRIAELFGVTRQRVSGLLREAGDDQK